MKKFVICMFALFAFAATGANAQTDNDASKTRKEMLAERKEIRKASKAELDTKAVKQARKEAKRLKKEGWNGSAHWMGKQADEEKEHALSLVDWVIKRGGEVRLTRIDEVPCGWDNLLEVFKAVYKHECHVSELIDELVDLASVEKDKATQDFLWGFVREQVEEEATASGIVDSLKRAGENNYIVVDRELGSRK